MKMERLLPLPAVLVLFLMLFSFTTGAEEASDRALKTPIEKFSYMLGMDIGDSLKGLETEIDLAVFMRAIEDVIKDRELLLSSEEAAEIKQTFLAERQAQAQAENEALAAKNLAEGEAFLAENKTKEGIKTTESGLQYQVIKEGDGPKPKVTDKVTVNYRGTLIDGTEFDSSYQRGEPVTFPLQGVIPGWTEGLQLMPVGSAYKFFIPPQLAYGERRVSPEIGPNATLIFEVELLDIVE